MCARAGGATRGVVCSNNPLAFPEPRVTLGQGMCHLYCTNQAKAGAGTSPSKGQIEEGAHEAPLRDWFYLVKDEEPLSVNKLGPPRPPGNPLWALGLLPHLPPCSLMLLKNTPFWRGSPPAGTPFFPAPPALLLCVPILSLPPLSPPAAGCPNSTSNVLILKLNLNSG